MSGHYINTRPKSFYVNVDRGACRCGGSTINPLKCDEDPENAKLEPHKCEKNPINT